MANTNLFQRLITSNFNLGTAVIGFYKIGIAGKPIFITSPANSFSSLVFSTSVLSSAILLQALKTAFNLSLISLIWLLPAV